MKTKMKELVLRTKLMAVPVASGIMIASAPFASYASDSSPTADVTSVVGIVTSVMTLFTKYPFNLFIAGALAMMGFRLFRSGKKAAK
ncbi:hypothetical protein HMPREF1020_03609 [Clostridium sp. 7_3_54FAA]|nr:hypothetical protein HMPREF1020_03609 [Clostridium sp. 7_3_54FAA]